MFLMTVLKQKQITQYLAIVNVKINRQFKQIKNSSRKRGTIEKI